MTEEERSEMELALGADTINKLKKKVIENITVDESKNKYKEPVIVFNYPDDFYSLISTSSDVKSIKKSYNILEFYDVKQINDNYYKVYIKTALYMGDVNNLSDNLKKHRQKYYKQLLKQEYDNNFLTTTLAPLTSPDYAAINAIDFITTIYDE